MRRVLGMCVGSFTLLTVGLALAAPQKKEKPHSKPAVKSAQVRAAKPASDYRPDIVTAVKANAKKDCGCGACAAKGCAPCKGKNCYFCVSKALVAQDCGCRTCADKGCGGCGPGCDVCKFHLGPVAEDKAGPKAPGK